MLNVTLDLQHFQGCREWQVIVAGENIDLPTGVLASFDMPVEGDLCNSILHFREYHDNRETEIVLGTAAGQMPADVLVNIISQLVAQEDLVGCSRLEQLNNFLTMLQGYVLEFPGMLDIAHFNNCYIESLVQDYYAFRNRYLCGGFNKSYLVKPSSTGSLCRYIAVWNGASSMLTVFSCANGINEYGGVSEVDTFCYEQDVDGYQPTADIDLALDAGYQIYKA